ncbi:MAG: MFS transporter [Clostridia bacterium]|nr:MFS transporter [Clostridia bacterium]
MNLLPEHRQNKKYYINLLISAYLLYVVSIAIKLCYSAQMVEIGPHFGVDKSRLSIGLTIYYLVYASAQLLLTAFVKKLNLKKFIGITVFLSGLTFSMMMFVNQIWQAWLILGVNGIFQVAIWGGCMSIFGKYFPDYLMRTVSNVMSTGMAIGTFLAYGVAAFFVAVLSWQWTFLFFGILTILTVIYFYVSEKKIEKNVGEVKINTKINYVNEKNKPQSKGFIVFMLMCFIGVFSFIVTIVYYALTNWVPNFLKEVHGVPSSYSILITLLLPIGIFFGPFFSSYLCKKNNNYFAVLIPLLIGAVIVMGLMIFLYDYSLILGIIMPVLILFLIRAVMNVLLAFLPLKMRGIIETGKSSLILNALACISAAIVPFISAIIMESWGWGAFFIFITIIGVVSLVLSIIGAIWASKRKFFEEKQNG